MKAPLKLTLALFALAVLAFGADAKIKIGVVPGVFGDSIAIAAKEAKAHGIDAQLVEFTDWTTINIATDRGDLDLNYYQHQAFLNNAIAKNGYKLASIGYGVLPNIGLYSLKHKSFKEIPNGGVAAIANDPINQGRGLQLLERAGLIKLKSGVGDKGTLSDIIDNPKKLRFVEVEGPQLARAAQDVDLAQGYPHFIVASKAFDASSGLIYSGIEGEEYAVRFVVPEAKKNDPILRKFVEIYQNSAAVKAAIHKGYAYDNRLYSLAWLNEPSASGDCH
ncbi:MAG: MetQ/NlpA family ABC transporter substrate-binding protein [Helicobacteraceae bacterium]|jgi:D-methionine transport system substrate-binding protein|nr:MetQ/NlpA family ABC transporter substrate-binding protein [Helicobacteraceae bacterium]